MHRFEIMLVAPGTQHPFIRLRNAYKQNRDAPSQLLLLITFESRIFVQNEYRIRDQRIGITY